MTRDANIARCARRLRHDRRMTTITCPDCGSDDTRVLQGSPPSEYVMCGACRRRWTHETPDCGDGNHDWRPLGGALGGRHLREKCDTCGKHRPTPGV